MEEVSLVYSNPFSNQDIPDLRPNTNTNYSEEVRVPSSEHVAEIVGRQGCKIKQLRAKTNTYIKTPEKGCEPVFVITGRFEDVKSAKKQIIEAAEHFTHIRASRRTNGVSGPIPDVPGQVTRLVPVPMHLVGLVVGSKGATIKKIQQMTQTHIMTPSREKDPVFEVTGLPENVMNAEKKMLDHIKTRTGVDNEDPLKVAVSLGLMDNAYQDIMKQPMSTCFWGKTATADVGMSDLSHAMALLDIKYPNNDMAYPYSGCDSLASSQGTSQASSNLGSSSESSPTLNHQNLNAYFSLQH